MISISTWNKKAKKINIMNKHIPDSVCSSQLCKFFNEKYMKSSRITTSTVNKLRIISEDILDSLVGKEKEVCN